MSMLTYIVSIMKIYSDLLQLSNVELKKEKNKKIKNVLKKKIHKFKNKMITLQTEQFQGLFDTVTIFTKNCFFKNTFG